MTPRVVRGRSTRERYVFAPPRATILLRPLQPDGRLLNRMLVEQGYAYADPRFDHHLEKEFKHLQAAAMNAHLGLWVNGPPKDIPDYYTNGKHKLPTK